MRGRRGRVGGEREELRAAASCFASARLACDTVAVPATAAALAAAAAALISTPPPRAGGAPRARDAPRRAAIARAFSRSASGLAAVLSAAPDPGRGEGATAAWGCLGYAPAACAAIIQLAADGAATPAAAGGAARARGWRRRRGRRVRLVATLFRSPASARVVMSRRGGGGVRFERGGGARERGWTRGREVGDVAREVVARAGGGCTRGVARAPGAAAAAAPHAAVAAALRNVLAYSASAKRAAAEADLVDSLLKIMTKSRKILAYDAAAAAAEEAARVAATAGSRGRGRDGVSDSFARAARPLGPAPKPLAMDADLVLSECVSLLKHALYCPPGAAAAAADAADEFAGGYARGADVDGAGETPESLGAAAAAARRDAMSRGVFSHVHALWRHAAADGELVRELLGAVANLTAGCAAAKRAAVEEVDAGDGAKPVSLAERMLRLAFRNTAPATTSRLALAPLAALATEPAARRWLLRSAFIAKTTEQFRVAVRRGDARRQVATLRALADVAGGGGEEGRREVLRVGGSDLVQLLLDTLAAAGVSGGSGPDEDEEDDIDIILSRVPEHARTVFQPQLPVAALEALLLLRNLCFHDEAKAHVAANPRALDALVAAAGATDAGARAAAADALLALVHNGQRVAALLRAGRRPARIPRAAGARHLARRRASRAHAEDASAGAGARTEAAAHASKCLAALAAVLGVAKGGDPVVGSGEGASPDSTLLDIDDEGLDRIAEECSDGLAVGPKWVY